jgi:hypothetical protein
MPSVNESGFSRPTRSCSAKPCDQALVTIENPKAHVLPLPAGEYRDRTLNLGAAVQCPSESVSPF